MRTTTVSTNVPAIKLHPDWICTDHPDWICTHEELHADESKNLDDTTLEDEPLDRFGAFDAIGDDGSLLDHAEASDALVIDEPLLASAEAGQRDADPSAAVRSEERGMGLIATRALESAEDACVSYSLPKFAKGEGAGGLRIGMRGS